MKIEEMRTADLIPYENNPRNNDDAVDAVAASIREFGFKVPIIVDKDNVIIAGHTRLKAAEKIGMETVPVVRADDLTDEKVRAFRLADNKTGELAGWDFEALEKELDALGEIDMSEFGFDNLSDVSDDAIKRDDVGIGENKWQIVIDCESKSDMQEKYNVIMETGIECRILTL